MSLADTGKDWDEMSHVERAVFVSQLNQKNPELDRAIAKRDATIEKLHDLCERANDLQTTIEEDFAIRKEERAESFIDSARDFLTIEDPPTRYIIPELTPIGVIRTSHGDPRTMKSLAAAEEMVAAVTGTPAYGLERFRPERSAKCLYCSQEDAAPRVRPRFNGLLKARGITEIPDTLSFAVFKGINLDSLAWQDTFIDGVVKGGFELVTIDPIRGFTANADKGPSEVMPIVKVLRRLTVLGIAVHLVHHDTKPPSSGPDLRRRSHRASGGGWFSASEAVISFEKICEGRSLVQPEDYKFSSDPKPFTITYQEDQNGIRLLGEDSTAQEAQSLAIDEAVLRYLAEQPAPGASTNSIRKGLRKQKAAVLESLDRLFKADKLDCVDGPRKAKLWTRRER